MKLIIYSFITLLVIVGVILVAMSIASRKQPELGLVEGQLQPCPGSPNCVCSEYPGKASYIEPLAYSGTADEAWSRLKQVISDTGGEVITEQAGYLHTVYETPLLRFVDDVEFRLDKGMLVIQVRSASRVGRSDFGANRKRVNRIREQFEKEQ